MQSTVASSDYLHIVTIDVYPVQVNWRVIIEDIKNAGLIPSQQAIALGKPWSTFSMWATGSEPCFGSGHALLILHAKTCGPALTERRLKESKLVE